jgi:hypothetical protein
VCQLYSRPHPGRLINAWTGTPTKWYPLPLAVGALLLVAIQYRKKVKRAQKEVQLDENGMEIIKLKGPWHVRPSSPPPLLSLKLIKCRYMFLALFRYGICHGYGVMLTHSNFLFGSDPMVYGYTLMLSVATSTKLNLQT